MPRHHEEGPNIPPFPEAWQGARGFPPGAPNGNWDDRVRANFGAGAAGWQVSCWFRRRQEIHGPRLAPDWTCYFIRQDRNRLTLSGGGDDCNLLLYCFREEQNDS